MSRILKLFISFTALFLVSCSSSTSDRKTLEMATNANFPPYEYVVKDGEYAGVDIEIAKELSKRLGLTLNIHNMPFDSIIASVASGKVDIGLSGFTVTEERKKSINFSDTYAKSKQVIIVTHKSPIEGLKDLYDEKSQFKVGVQLSTTGAIYFGDDIKNKKLNSTMVEFHNGADAISALSSGKIDCVIIDSEPAKSFIVANQGLKILETEYIEEEYAMVVSKDKPDLLVKINKTLAEMKTDGTIEKILNKYIN